MAHSAETRKLLRQLPSVQSLLLCPELASATEKFGRAAATDAARQVLEVWRDRILGGLCNQVDASDLQREVVEAIRGQAESSLRGVINATGVLLHTNLGRAPLSIEALRRVQAVAGGFSTLEYDLETGRRSDRYVHCRRKLQLLTGAEDALAVNNNAGALLLVLTALCRDREVIVSRGQLVEIGGGFRIPDILRQSGAELIEVGTTNRTNVEDYAEAFTTRTRAILCVHESNFRMTGFVRKPTLSELSALVERRRQDLDSELLLLHDLGSGSLRNHEGTELTGEQTVAESVSQGADVTAFSGDKLLGGPQAGIIVGRRRWVSRLLRHPLLRALRMDKMGLAALEATLDAYLAGRASSELPLLQMGSRTTEALRARAQAICGSLAEQGIHASELLLDGAVGGGSLPGRNVPSVGVGVETTVPEELALRLRRHDPPIISRIAHERLCFDLRTVEPEDDKMLCAALAECQRS